MANSLEYTELSEEAKEVVKGMVEFCINNGMCMGMDEGFKSFGNGRRKIDAEKHRFRKELESFSGFKG